MIEFSPKAAAVLSVLMLTNGIARAQQLAARPVGVVAVRVAPGEQKIVSTPFLPFDDGIDAVLRGQMTGAGEEENADAVLAWDSAANEYAAAYKAGGTGDPDKEGKWFGDLSGFVPSSMTILPGDGFILCNRQAWTQTVWLAGNVIFDKTVEIEMNPGLTLFGPPFAGAVELGDTDIDPKETIGADGRLKHGHGYWYRRQSDTAAARTLARPYADPFGDNDALPKVSGIACAEEGIVLKISASGAAGELLDVLSQDVACDSAFDPRSGWRVRARNLIAGNGAVTWTDGPENLPGPLVARCYLVVRGDIDSDANGVPDSHEIFVAGAAPSISTASAFPPGQAPLAGGTPPGGAQESGMPTGTLETEANETTGPGVTIRSPVNGGWILQ
jgi:hypothetical protein